MAAADPGWLHSAVSAEIKKPHHARHAQLLDGFRIAHAAFPKADEDEAVRDPALVRHRAVLQHLDGRLEAPRSRAFVE